MNNLISFILLFLTPAPVEVIDDRLYIQHQALTPIIIEAIRMPCFGDEIIHFQSAPRRPNVWGDVVAMFPVQDWPAGRYVIRLIENEEVVYEAVITLHGGDCA